MQTDQAPVCEVESRLAIRLFVSGFSGFAAKSIDQAARGPEISRVEAFREAVVDGGDQRGGFAGLSVPVPQRAQACCGAQLPSQGMLLARQGGPAEIRFGRGYSSPDYPWQYVEQDRSDILP
jgi:hypothetical protein